MLVIAAAVFHAALLLSPLQAGAPTAGQAAPTPTARSQVAPPGQTPPEAGPAGQAGSPKVDLPKPPAELPPIEAPPALPASRAEALGREISKLTATNPAALKAAQDTVIGYGRAALAALTKASTTKHPGQMDSLVLCLTMLADYRDRDLVETSLTSPHVVLRRFGARKAGEYALPELLNLLPPLLKDKDAGVQLEATLALLANGREDGLAIAAAVVDGPAKDRVLAVLPAIADQGGHELLAALLRIDPQREKEEPDVAAKERLSAVLLLHAIGDTAAEGLLVTALDDKHNVVQRAAIDSLRDLLEHQGPMDKSSIFQQINEVKRLKEVWQNR